MSLEVMVHGAQTNILRELLFVQEAGFADLQRPTGLTSDHFNFHIGRLVEAGLVEKVSRGRYRLTVQGKEYANRLDTDQRTIERQPKVAVLLAAKRMGQNGQEWLFQERLKNPYYGYWGWPSGKIGWGETIEEAAARELREETGLTAELRVMGLYHEHTFLRESRELVEDKMFFVVRCDQVEGDLIERFEGGRNAWMGETEVAGLAKKYRSFAAEMAMAKGAVGPFIHEIHEYSKDEF